jgi:hypothetical protein
MIPVKVSHSAFTKGPTSWNELCKGNESYHQTSDTTFQSTGSQLNELHPSLTGVSHMLNVTKYEQLRKTKPLFISLKVQKG